MIMTRAVQDRILKEANGDISDISDHLRNHIHLTNCIHLKNHMHKQSPISTERSLVRDLIVLQRSRSLRDPSASPPSWKSPSVVDILSKKGETGSLIQEGRRSVERFATSKVAPHEVSRRNDDVSQRSNRNGVRDRRIRREESSRKSILSGNEEPPGDQDGNHPVHELVFGESELKNKRTKQKGKHIQDIPPKTLSEQLHDITMDSDDLASSNIRGRSIHVQQKGVEEPETSHRGPNKIKRRKFQGARRNRATSISRDIRARNELSVASNSLAQGSAHLNYNEEEEDQQAYQNVTKGPKNGCGLPWNWSIIHNRGKTFLDKAGRSLSCGLSDSRLRRGGPSGLGADMPNIPISSDQSSPPPGKYNAEALPLLLEASGSQQSVENANWAREFSGELGIFADNLYKDQVDDSDLASEARSGNQRKLRGHHRNRHQNLTQKYMPRTFRELVGQNLVTQALSNAIVKKKVGLLYVFYGPHGTGKTSCARIFARALNCQSLENPKPCGFCNSCLAHEMGKTRNIREVGPVSNFDYKSIMEILDHTIVSQMASQHRVLIFYDCDTLTPDCWSAILKVIDRAPRHVVFILVSSSLDVLPHIIISRCQKFFFPKLKDADIIYTLQCIATKEDVEINKDALKLIASRSDGSLRDAEMTLEQLSLLGQRISVPLVQELVGLVSDEKLVDLLDLALSADTVNTVKNLRLIMETGVEPLSLMSQLATVITDIVAGSYDLTKERPRRRFFRRQPLSKEDMEKLRQALKTLSEAEKQLRMSNDKLTWLTAALLQLAPDQQYTLPSSLEASSNHSPLALNNVSERNGPSKGKGLSTNSDIYDNGMRKSVSSDRNRNVMAGMAPQQGSAYPSELTGNRISAKNNHEIWLEVLEKIQINGIKEFLMQEAKLISVSFGAAPAAQLMFSSHQTKSKAEKFRAHILQAFESVLGPLVTIEISCRETKNGPSEIGYTNGVKKVGTGEIVEVEASPREMKSNDERINNREGSGRSLEGSRKKSTDQSKSQSIVKSKVSLAHVLQQAEGCSQRSEWSRCKAVSIAEKLEQENLRLEPQSRRLLCWNAPRVTRKKLARLKIRTRRPHSLTKLVSCGKCLSVKSPR